MRGQAATDPSKPMPNESCAAARLARDRLARHDAPFVWQEVARRLAERLPLLRLQPRCALDLGCAWGDGLALLRQRYPEAELLGIEPSPRLAERARQRNRPRGWMQRLRAGPACRVLDAELDCALPSTQGAAQLLWSNLALCWAADPAAVLGAWQRMLLPDGALMFTAFGPDTLRELRTPEVAGLGMRARSWMDMHDLGDLLVHQGFADPVMDMELLQLRWADADSALRELALLGRVPHAQAYAGLRTPRNWQRLRDWLQARAGASGHGQVELSFEIVYGHAFKPATSRASQGGVASIGLEQIGGRRASRPG